MPAGPVTLQPATDEALDLWLAVIDIAKKLGPDQDWCLVGGLMVHLLCQEHEQTSRPTTDIDLLGNARSRPSETSRISQVLSDSGASLSLPPRTSEDTGYQFLWREQAVEIPGSRWAFR